MEAIDVLMAEHRVIERVLVALETAAGRLSRGEAVRPGLFADAADFAAGFADGCHHRKEEGVLFPAMTAHGEAPIDVMLEEHEAGRVLVRQMRAAARRLEGDPSAASQVVAAARGYIALLRDHIEKEDEMLFPMADELIPASEQAGVLSRFDDVEHEETGPAVHERFLGLAARIEREATEGAR